MLCKQAWLEHFTSLRSTTRCVAEHFGHKPKQRRHSYLYLFFFIIGKMAEWLLRQFGRLVPVKDCWFESNFFRSLRACCASSAGSPQRGLASLASEAGQIKAKHSAARMASLASEAGQIKAKHMASPMQRGLAKPCASHSASR